MSLHTDYKKFRNDLPENVVLVAVSKTKPIEEILRLYEMGQRDFGENYVQELGTKYESLPKDIRWHFIGHLQSNKVKYIAPFVHLIHGVDSLKLLIEVNKQAKKNERIIDCLLQVHIAEEETKFGFDESEILYLLKNGEFRSLENIRIKGVMGMASNTDSEIRIRNEFRVLKGIFGLLKNADADNIHAEIISMGMSSDYKIAIQEGSTMIRIGSLLFGERNYN